MRRIELRFVSDRVESYETEEELKIRKPIDVFKALPHLSDLVQEEMHALYLNTCNKVMGDYLVSRGSLTATYLKPADVIRPALLLGAGRIILVHNHPSGDCEPSFEDLVTTKNMREAIELVGLELFDHVIIGGGNYVSLRERGNI